MRKRFRVAFSYRSVVDHEVDHEETVVTLRCHVRNNAVNIEVQQDNMIRNSDVITGTFPTNSGIVLFFYIIQLCLHLHFFHILVFHYN